MIGWEFPPRNSGGLGVACFGLVRALAKEGAEITFLLPGDFAPDLPYARFVALDDPQLREPELVSYAAGVSGASSPITKRVMIYASLVKKFVSQFQDFDVVHAHDWLSAPAGMAAAEVSGKPLVLHVHATEYDRCGGTGYENEIGAIEKTCFSSSINTVAVSNYTKALLVDKYGLSPENIQVVHNGIDSDMLPAFQKQTDLSSLKKNGNAIVLFLGRLTAQKGLLQFIESAQIVLKHRANTRFIIAGDGDMKGEVVRRVAALGLSDKIFVYGFARGEEVTELYQNADVYVMPSISEPFGITPLEAISIGIPVIISKQSGVSEVVSGALKADFWDTEEFASKIISCIEHAPLRNELISRSKKELLTLTWKEAAKKCMAAYARALNPKT